MNYKRRQEALRFMFDNSQSSKWWLPGALTKEANPEGNPPGLTLAEAQSLFYDLVQKQLLCPTLNSEDRPCYILNECKEKEWQREISQATRPRWLRSESLNFWVWKLFDAAVAFGAGALGGWIGTK